MHMNFSHLDPVLSEVMFSDFLKLDIRVGEVKTAEIFQKAKKPAYILTIDFGVTIGLKKTSAQITKNYQCEELVGRQVAAVVNFPKRQIAQIMSEVLTLGFADSDGEVVLFKPDKKVPNGSRLF